MRLGTTLGLAALATAAGITGVQAQTKTAIYVYNFNDATTSSTGGANATAANTTSLFSMDRNNSTDPNGSILSTNFNPTDNSGGATAPSGVVSFTGTVMNADAPPAGSDPAGAALALVSNGSGTTTAGTFVSANNGKYLQATADLAGFQSVGFSFAIQKTGTGFSSDTFQYSLNGTDFTTFAAFTPASSFAAATDPSGVSSVQSFDLTSIAGLNGDRNAAFRIVFDGATSTSGNNRLDNLTITGLSAPVPTPEASTTASFGLLLALGLGGVITSRRRKRA